MNKTALEQHIANLCKHIQRVCDLEVVRPPPCVACTREECTGCCKYVGCTQKDPMVLITGCTVAALNGVWGLSGENWLRPVAECGER